MLLWGDANRSAEGIGVLTLQGQDARHGTDAAQAVSGPEGLREDRSVTSVADLEDCFGPARGHSGVGAWQAIEAVAGELPADYKEFVAAYGPGVIGNFLCVLHPQSHEPTMVDMLAAMGPLYQVLVPHKIPYGLYPRERGMLLWATTHEGDGCFLIPRPDGTWGIGVWFRQWAQWEEYDQGVPGWLVSQATGDLEIPGLPLRTLGGFVPQD